MSDEEKAQFADAGVEQMRANLEEPRNPPPARRAPVAHDDEPDEDLSKVSWVDGG